MPVIQLNVIRIMAEERENEENHLLVEMEFMLKS